MSSSRQADYLSSFRGWFKKHRRAVIATCAVAGTGVSAYYYMKWQYARAEEEKKRAEALQLMAQEAEARADAQLQSHFESIQRISDATTLPSVLPHLKSRLFQRVDLTILTEKLMNGKQSPASLTGKEKLQIWQELKIRSFTRTICGLVAVGLLDLFVRIQLNILGRHVYIDTATSSSGDRGGMKENRGLPMSCQHKFIAFADYLSHKGLDALISDVQSVVEVVLKSKSLKEHLDIDSLKGILEEMQQGLDKGKSSWLLYVLPENNVLPKDLAAASVAADKVRTPGGISADMAADPLDDAMLEQLMTETRSVLQSHDFHKVFAKSMEAMLDVVMEDLGPSFRDSPEKGIPLAKLLPPIASIGTSLLDHAQHNKYIKALAQLQEVKDFCANVYADSGRYLQEAYG